MEDTENTKKKGYTVATARVPNDLYEKCQLRMVRTKESFQSVLLAALEEYAAADGSAMPPRPPYQVTEDDRNTADRLLWWVRNAKTVTYKGTIYEALADMVLAEIVKIK